MRDFEIEENDMQQIICPGCNQGRVFHVRIKASDKRIFVCEECETTWMSREEIGVKQPVNFAQFLRANELKGEWAEVEDVVS
jgi:ribosomal protein L37AE/L43A